VTPATTLLVSECCTLLLTSCQTRPKHLEHLLQQGCLIQHDSTTYDAEQVTQGWHVIQVLGLLQINKHSQHTL
jgi:hypothetical protein